MKEKNSKANLIIISICVPMILLGQIPDSLNSKIDQAQEIAIINWMANLNEKGLEMTDDSLFIGNEFHKVLNDASYRDTIYPETYSWEQALGFIKTMELKKAFWFFINLYAENDLNKELVIKSVLTYDQLFKMDEIMVNTFYTYCFMDPEISIIQDGKPEIVHPDILEAKMRTVKEIVGYIIGYRQQQQTEVSGE
nr:hypothetical protein [Bacteroidota bacterium]